MKILSSVLVILISMLLFTGCAQKHEPIIITEVDVQEKVVESGKCNIPEISCDFKGEGFEPTKRLLECVILQKKYLDICTGKTKL